MIRIRRIFDDTLPSDKQALRSVQAIQRGSFRLLHQEEIDKLPDLLTKGIHFGFRTILFVAEDERRVVNGFATLLHFADLHFCLLDFISVTPKASGRGLGSALYERVREEALWLGSTGLFFEALPDDPELCPDPDVLRENRLRLRFYERYGARPIVGTAYETPLHEEDTCPPYLVYDPLDSEKPLRRARARAVVKAILERKYAGTCPRPYVAKVLASFTEDPVRLREPKYRRKETTASSPMRPQPWDRRIAVVVNDRHDIHHVRERGYVEAPVRVRRIADVLDPLPIQERVEARHFPDRHVEAMHDREFTAYLKKVCYKVGSTRSVYPYVFPLRNAARPPRDLPIRAGYYCIDTFTPLNRNAYLAARRAVDCGLTAAEEILKGRRIAYALVRPPGHHAERRAFGGFCYFNTAAIAANLLSNQGRVAVLDVDYHHGNGTQNLFFTRSDVLTVSIHGHPGFAYPYFSGFREETGEGEGAGFNRNFPLQERVDGEMYRNVLLRALRLIEDFAPMFLVVALGLDTAKGDPTGTWSLTARDLHANGRMVGGMRLPTLLVQEGGYKIRSLGTNARGFLEGLWEGWFANR